MTGNVDLDRLADYVGGALGGTPDQAAVARLIATDPVWTRAHADLVAADALVRADLAALAADPVPIPDDVAASLTAALDAESPLTGPAPADSPARLSVLPGGRTTPAPVRRRWRAVAGVAAAAVVLGLGGVTLAQGLRNGGEAQTLARNSSGGALTASGGAPLAPDAAAVEVRASGSDYTASTLAALGGASTSAPGHDSVGTESRPDTLEAPPRPSVRPTAVPDALSRLFEPAARAACLKAILARYGGTATMVDYARYEGSPALVVLLEEVSSGTGRKWVIAVGPNCGAAGANTDQRYSGPVG